MSLMRVNKRYELRKFLRIGDGTKLKFVYNFMSKFESEQFINLVFSPAIPTKTEIAPSIYDGIHRNIKPFTSVKFKFQVSEVPGSKIEEDVIKGVANYFKNISLALANVAIELHLAKYVEDTVLREQLLKNERFRTILIKSLHKIESYLDEMGLEHDTKVGLWQDKELNWNEIVINVKIDYRSHEEKMKIWKDLCRILDEVDEDNRILIEVNRL